LLVSFGLVNAKGEYVASRGSGTVELFDALGNLVARWPFTFSKEDFGNPSKKVRLGVPKTTLDLSHYTTGQSSVALAIAVGQTALTNGRATLRVVASNDNNMLVATYDNVEVYPAQEVGKAIRSVYFREDIKAFQEEINKQWPFKVRVNDYAMIGNRGWAVVSRTGEEIIFYPYGKIYDWYLLETKDAGKSWDIAWRGDTAPRFSIEPSVGSDIKVTTPSGTFHINSRGEQAVYFADAKLEALIKEAIGKTESPIYPSDLASLTAFSGVGKDITDLTGLEHCVNLKELHLQKNRIKDLSPLASLGHLSTLSLHDNQIRDISPLSNLTGLTELKLTKNQINNIAALGTLTKLRYLYLSENQVRDISVLARLPNLKIVMLSHNQISDISPLVRNTGLGKGDEVGLTGNPLSQESLNKHLSALRERGVDVIWPVTAPSVVTASEGKSTSPSSQGSGSSLPVNLGPGPDPP